ncbi:MAG: class I SAM-dependent methyltransferase [Thermodesulfobacteriota bacterium]
MTTFSSNQNKVWRYFQNISPETFEGARPRLDCIIKEISKKTHTSIPRVLNIGAGDGYLEETARRHGWDSYSLDPDTDTIKKLNEKGIKGQVGYIERMPFDDESFDFVVASEVLEHLNDELCRKAVMEVFRVIVQGGWFLGTVPYCENLLLNQVVCPRCGEVFHRWGHRQSFDIKTIQNELSGLFEIVKLKKTAFVTFRGRSAAGKIKSLIRIVLAKYGSAIAEPNIYFEVRKPPQAQVQ